MGYSDLAEDTHWPPFLKTAVDYWSEKYYAGKAGGINDSLASWMTEVEERREKRDVSKLGKDIKLGLFQKVLDVIKYKEKGPTGNAESTELALKAFIFGILTHQVADISWHSLGVQQGLLRMLSNREFNGDVSEAHNILDTGGDMIYVRRLLQSGLNQDWMQGDWKYPTDDLLEIISRAGYKGVTSSQLDYCMFRGKAALGAELQLARSAFAPYAQKSPLLFEHIDDYYLGGVTEMSMASRHCSYSLAEWFNNRSTPADPWSVCEVYEGMRGKSYQNSNYLYMNETIDEMDESEDYGGRGFIASGYKSKFQVPLHPPTRQKDGVLDISLQNNNIFGDEVNNIHNNEDMPSLATIISSGVPNGAFGSSVVIGNFLKNESCLAISAPFESEILGTGSDAEETPKGSVYVVELSQLMQRSDLTTKSPARMITLDIPPDTPYQFNERFGAKMDKINLLGYDVLIISRPGSSRLSFFLENENIFNIYWGKASVKYGSSGAKLAGESLAVGDVDGDGVEDLVVGSPYSDIRGHPQSGEVHVVNGISLQAIFSIAVESRHRGPLEFDIKDVAEMVLHLPSLTSSPGYSLFGSKVSLVSRGQSSYLLVGAEGVGKVFAFDGKQNFKHIFVLSGNTRSGSNFGGKLLKGNDEGWIAVGSTTEDVFSDRSGRLKCSQCGAIYLYRIKDGSTVDEIKYTTDELNATESIYLTYKTRKGMQTGSFSRFGHEGTIIGNFLYTSSPFGQNERGQIWRYDLSKHGKSNFELLIEESPWPYSNGFGTSLAGIKQDGEILLASGMPYYGSNERGWLQGAVAVYSLKG